MSDIKKCPNCGTEIKNSVFSSSVQLLHENQVWVCNLYNDNKVESYCSKCGYEPLKLALEKWSTEKEELIKSVSNLIKKIPVITIQSPLNWDYDVLSIITSQSVLGTGLITEFASSFTDMLGMQSNRFNEKLKQGEDLCFNQLRTEALDIGANAIIASDIDYSEVGGVKGMLMVCIAGTGVHLKNIEILGNETKDSINKLKIDYERLKFLRSKGNIIPYL